MKEITKEEAAMCGIETGLYFGEAQSVSVRAIVERIAQNNDARSFCALVGKLSHLVSALPDGTYGGWTVARRGTFDDSSIVVAPSNATIKVTGDVVCFAFGNAKVVASGHAQVIAYGNAEIVISGSAHALCYNNVFAKASGDAHVVVYDECECNATDKANVIAHNSATLNVNGKAKAILFDNCKCYAFDSTMIEAYGKSQVWGSHNVTVQANTAGEVTLQGSAFAEVVGVGWLKLMAQSSAVVRGWVKVQAFDNSHVIAYAATVEAFDEAFVEADHATRVKLNNKAKAKRVDC